MTTVMIIQNRAYVLLAANLDDFRSIAKKFVPEPLANKLADLAAKSGFQYRHVEESQDSESVYSDDRNERDEGNKRGGTKKDDRLAKINFDDLVSKVKEQIEKDLYQPRQTKAMKKNPVPEYGEQEIPVSRDTNARIERTTKYKREPKLKGQVKRPMSKPTHNDGQKLERQRRPIPKPVNDDALTFSKIEMIRNDSYEDYVTPKKEDNIFESDDNMEKQDNDPTTKKHKYLNTHDDIKKVKDFASKEGDMPVFTNNNDDDEKLDDYASKDREMPEYTNNNDDVKKLHDIPNKERDVTKYTKINEDSEKLDDYASKEGDIPVYTNNNENVEKLSEFVSKDGDMIEYTNNNDDVKKLHDIPSKSKDVSKYAHNNDDEEKLEKRPVTEKDIPEYANQETENPVEHTYDDKPEEFQAQTGDLWYDESQTKVTEDFDTTTPMKGKGKNLKNTTKRKGTMIPKRDFYKMSSPNYAAKVPIVAEKYDFDEPIPENDRVPEILKPIKGLAPVIINGKVRVKS